MFLAIELPDAVREHLASMSRPLSDFVVAKWGRDYRISVTRPENLHVTLKFLGEVEESAVGGLREALARVSADGPIPLRADGCELLPPRGPIRVVAAGLAGDDGRLRQLHRAVEACCDEQGFPPERRDFRPHVTLARARDAISASARARLSDQLRASLPGPPFEVKSFSLIESRLRMEGPQYMPLARFPI